MIDRERLSRHGWALGLLFAGLFLGLSLVGYDPADPPAAAAHPANDPVVNPCGPVGAALAVGLFQAFGWCGFFVLYALLVLDLHAFRGRRVADWGLRLAGFALVLAVAAAVLGAVEQARGTVLLSGGPPVGGGGYLGALLAGWLSGQFGRAGLVLILVGTGLLGLALCRETFFAWPAHELLRLARRGRPSPSAEPAGLHPIGTALAPVALDYGVPRDRPPLAAPLPTAARPALARAVDAAPVGLAPARAAQVPAVPPPFHDDGRYIPPPPELLEPPAEFPIHEHEAKVQERALMLEKALREHGCIVRVVQIDTGPVITQFEIELEPGLRVSRIVGLANDLAIALAVPSVRIVSPIPGKTTVGIEVPNERRAMVRLGEVFAGVGDRLGKLRIPLFLGKDVKGLPLSYDLAEMPHLLIAGRTGTGKSVCLNAMIVSILMTKRPEEVKLILIDPKKVELSQFKRIPHLMHPVITDEKKAESLLSWACDKMDERYGYLARAEVRNVQAYNALGAEEIYNRLRPEDEEERARIPTYMPYIVMIIDEMGDLIAQVGKEVETHIVRLAQKARAAGIHLILATQKPTVEVITGLIKSNLPARISFQVSSRNDSRVVLDEMGAEKLLGNGDMLFLVPGTSHIVRAQGTYVSDAEVNRVCGYLERYPVEFSKELIGLPMAGAGGKDRSEKLKERDELYESAIEIIIQSGRGSTSMLQRALGIGYGRAARMIDYMAEDGIVGEYKTGGAREVLYTWEEWEALKGGDADGGEAA